MIGVCIAPVNIRAEMLKASLDMGDLVPCDVVIGTVLNGWIAFDRVYRKSLNGKPEVLPTTRYAAIYEPTSPTTKYIMLVDVNTPAPVPVPAPVIQPLSVEVSGEGYQTVNVELKPV